jgi:hypothetical protein
LRWSSTRDAGPLNVTPLGGLGAEAVLRLVARAGVVDRDPGGAGQPGAEHIASFGAEAIMAVIEQADLLALGDEDAERARNSVTSRGVLGEHATPSRCGRSSVLAAVTRTSTLSFAGCGSGNLVCRRPP